MTPSTNSLPRHTRERINKLAHWSGLRHETQLKSDLVSRLLEIRTTEGNAAIAPALERIEAALGVGGYQSLDDTDPRNHAIPHAQNKTPIED